MQKTARINDMHTGVCGHGFICCPHAVTGVIVTGSPDVFVNGRPVARLNDAVIHNCPHCGTGTITSASETVLVNGFGIARIGDEVTYPGGGGHIITASDDVAVG